MNTDTIGRSKAVAHAEVDKDGFAQVQFRRAPAKAVAVGTEILKLHAAGDAPVRDQRQAAVLRQRRHLPDDQRALGLVGDQQDGAGPALARLEQLLREFAVAEVEDAEDMFSNYMEQMELLNDYSPEVDVDDIE